MSERGPKNWRLDAGEWTEALSKQEERALTPGDPDLTRRILESAKRNQVKRGRPPGVKNKPKNT